MFSRVGSVSLFVSDQDRAKDFYTRVLGFELRQDAPLFPGATNRWVCSVDPKTKEVKLPDDLSSALKKNKKQSDFFSTLSFTNKKEYIEWIVTAKREETRNERIKGTIERLGKSWKNPRNM